MLRLVVSRFVVVHLLTHKENGVIAIAASGDANPSRVLKYIRIGAAHIAKKPFLVVAYLIASAASLQPRALSLKVAPFSVMVNRILGE